MDQKMMKIFGAIIVGFVVFILILFLIASCSKKGYTFEKLENKMVEVAKKYYEKNKNELPQEDKDTRTYTLKKMISNGEIDNVSKLFDKKDLKCDGEVTVTNNKCKYIYTVHLDCGKDYQTKYLVDKIIEDTLVEKGFGLYKVNNQYIMKGEVQNNYVSYKGKLYRIMRINEDRTIRLYEVDGIDRIVWDDRFNGDLNYNSGINEYYHKGIDSRLKESLTNYYKDSSAWPDDLKKYIVTQDLCIGKRANDDKTMDGSTECSVKLPNQDIGVISVYEFLQASLDDKCSYTTDQNCLNYNWLSNDQLSTWTVTGDTNNSSFVYILYRNTILNSCSSFASVNAVFNISDKVTYVTGNGTKENPYQFR